MYIVFQGYRTFGTDLWGDVYAITCSSAQYTSTNCIDEGDWDTLLADYDLDYATLSNSLDTDVALDGTIHVTYSERVLHHYILPGRARLRHGRTAGYGRVRDPGQHERACACTGQFDNDWGVAGNSSLALDLGLDGSKHIAYLGSPDGIHYLSCSSACDSSGPGPLRTSPTRST